MGWCNTLRVLKLENILASKLVLNLTKTSKQIHFLYISILTFILQGKIFKFSLGFEVTKNTLCVSGQNFLFLFCFLVVLIEVTLNKLAVLNWRKKEEKERGQRTNLWLLVYLDIGLSNVSARGDRGTLSVCWLSASWSRKVRRYFQLRKVVMI